MRHVFELIPPETLLAFSGNSRVHPEQQIQDLMQSIRSFGFSSPIVADEANEVIAGHGRLEAARRLGLKAVPVVRLYGLTESQKRGLRVAENRIHDMSFFDADALSAELSSIPLDDLSGFNLGLEDLLDLPEDPPPQDAESPTPPPQAQRRNPAPGAAYKKRKERAGFLFSDFIFPPTTFLNLNSSIRRTRAWEQHIGYDMADTRAGVTYSTRELGGSTASTFSPSLAELLVSWFCPRGGRVLDPFAGGPVRGAVTGCLGRSYVGFDIRPEQVAANERQKIRPPDPSIFRSPVWVCRDIRSADTGAPPLSGGGFDFILTCPPYASLEVYSDYSSDISNMGYAQFMRNYRQIIRRSLSLLKEDRFAAFVVGDLRTSTGHLAGFVRDTELAFKSCGADLYNSAVLATQGATTMLRARSVFRHRKLVPSHQNVLVFCKGDPERAAKAAAAGGVLDVLGGADEP